jgi:hypothetical protein
VLTPADMPLTLSLNNYTAEASTRRALANLSLSVAKCKKIVVVTGAGISCSCGIPVSKFGYALQISLNVHFTCRIFGRPMAFTLS